ncbi:tetratricopeptide repeat protein [Granulicella arctica]|uniref:tetratricopeptide repeat protein n=1 Tax=Granulicella arctica TaxID=940613 RepID=UPI0021E0CD8E|nr:tetratricopeptide repeat protein [Granulicella arctica]
MKIGTRSLQLMTLIPALFALRAALAQAPPQDARVQDAFQRGAIAMRNGRADDAEKAFRLAVSLAPQLPEAHLDLGLVLGREGKLDEAISAIDAALHLSPHLDSASMFLGIFEYQANRPLKAESALEQELAHSPDNVEALTWLGTVELGMGHPERAVAPLDHAHELAPKDLNVLEYRGRAHSAVARESYSAMALVDPNSWHVRRVRAQLYADEGRHPEAIAEYVEAIKLETRNSDLYEALGDEYRASNQLEEARKAYAKELELSPQNLIAMYNLGSTEVDLGAAAEGVPLLTAMLARSGPIPVVEYYLGRGLVAEGSETNGVKYLEKCIADGHDSEVVKRAWYELARAYRKLQRTADAAHATEEYARLRELQEKQNAQQLQDWRKLEPTSPGAV